MAAEIPASFPSTMLHTNQRVVKEAAQAEPVLITCADNHNLVMASNQQLAQRATARQRENDYEFMVCSAIERAQFGIAIGDYVVGVDAAIAESERMRLARS